MSRQRITRKRNCLFLALVMVLSQSEICAVSVGAENREYSGVTQIAEENVYLNMDTLEVELEISEVYAEAGSQVSEGDRILKLTSDSYQKAVAYYSAAVIKAESNLTDVQLAYDQGVLESKYTYESAKVKADQAELVKEYQEKELADTLEDHEEVLEDLDERIAELESGICLGSYETGSSSGGGGSPSSGSSGSSSSGGAASSGGQKPETENSPDAARETESETEIPDSESKTTESETQSTTEHSVTEPETEPVSSEQTEKETLLQELSLQIEEKNKEYDEIVEQIEALGFDLTGQKEETSEERETEPSGSEGLEKELQDSVTGDSNVKTNLENVQNNLSSVPEALMKMVETAYPDYEDYIQLLDACIDQLDYDIQKQEAILEALKSQNAEDEKQVDQEKLEILLASLWKTGMERNNLYQQIIDLKCQQIRDLELSAQEKDPEKEQETGRQPESEQTTERETGRQPELEQTTEQQEKAEESSEKMSSGGMPSGNGGSGGGSGSVSGVSGSVQIVGTSDNQVTGSMGLSEDEISLFGGAYDLTQIKNLIEREPSDTDQAEELLEELQDGRKTVIANQEELTRNQKITELEIQYTYDCSVIEGKLAEITYTQQMQEWNEKLAEAKAEKSDMESQKAFLENMTDGVLVSDRDGIIAEVFCESEDLISGTEPLMSYYDTDKVMIVIEIPQEEISEISVGDTANVVIGGFMSREGTVTKKEIEPQSDTSRTLVQYEAEITVDNEEGLLGAGTSVTVSFGSENGTSVSSGAEGGAAEFRKMKMQTGDAGQESEHE